jgi:hypothetical protein
MPPTSLSRQLSHSCSIDGDTAYGWKNGNAFAAPGLLQLCLSTLVGLFSTYTRASRQIMEDIPAI